MTDLSVDARLLATEQGAAPRINSAAVTFASALVVAGALALANYYTWRQGALFLLGAALGVPTRCSASPRLGASSFQTAAAPDYARKW